ncbi:hypothetical protein [Streptomyces sp. STCH 565 A]|uniref:hypothetical protein n=1 Tax=Streptomyces sp. STCH 565 A TaxID=2950532 RepID=UPI002075F5B8|nr:hypothetical protein [Streptomyces sp. STCH 565 A]MCM8552149.1 hypothetical protein [Streptomyces sp. STCH 565 A]
MSAGTGGRGELFADGTDGDRTAAAAAGAGGGTRRTAAAGAGPGTTGGSVTAVTFSDRAPGPAPAAAPVSPVPPGAPPRRDGSAPLPRARTAAPGAAPRRREQGRERGREKKPWGKIAQRIVPYDLQPDVLRQELVDLGNEFRAYQRSPEPDLAVLAELHDRKARAFAAWATVADDATLREEAERAEAAARTTREMNANRLGLAPDGDGPVIERLLTRVQGAHARSVLEYVRVHAPLPTAQARLAVLMLTLRSARAGTGNVTGQDLGGWLQGDAERVLEQLVDVGWLRLPDEVTAADVLDARPEEPVQVTVPALLLDAPRPFSFGKVTRARLSGWAQRTVGDRKLRKKKSGAGTRLLAVYTAAHSRPDGRLGGAGEDEGLGLDAVTGLCGLPPGDVAEHAGLLVAADWLADGEVVGGRLRGRLAERVLPLSGLL